MENSRTDHVISYWGVENIIEEYDRIIALGVTPNEKPYNVGGEIMTATLKDPLCNVIRLIYNPYFKVDLKFQQDN